MKKVFLIALTFAISFQLFAQQEIRQNVYFDYDVYSLSAEAKQLLDKISASIDKKSTVTLKGHTDADGSDLYNINLSQQRTRSVYNYLKSKGFESIQFNQMSYGESIPQAGNLLENDKQLNRRVEVLIATNTTNVEPIAAKNVQKFLINTLKDTTIICAQGTKISIYSNSFEAENSNQILPENLTISVQEFYKISDILMANLNTNSNNQLLETGGMINITASDGANNYVLKKNQNIEIGFAATKIKSTMEIFNGEWQDDKRINWIKSSSNDQFLISAEVMPAFPGGEAALFDYLTRSIRYPETEKELGIGGTVIVGFIVNKKGEIKFPRVIKGVSKNMDLEAVRALLSMPKWSPGKIGGVNQNIQINLPIKFSISEPSAVNNKIKNKNMKGPFRDTSTGVVSTNYLAPTEQMYDSLFNSLNEEDLIFNTLYSANLGWINCDRFVNQIPQMTYTVSTSENQVDVKLIFEKYKSIYSGVKTGNGYNFLNVPEGEKITIVATMIKNNKKYLAIKESTISRIPEDDLDFKEVNMQTYLEELKKLDRFN